SRIRQCVQCQKTNNVTTERNKMKSMFPLTLAAVVSRMLITSVPLRAADAGSAATPTSGADSANNDPLDLYHSNELSLDGFGSASAGKYTLNHVSGSNIRHNAR